MKLISLTINALCIIIISGSISFIAIEPISHINKARFVMSNTLKGMPDMPVPYHQTGLSAQQAYVMHTILWQNNPLKTTFGRLLFPVLQISTVKKFYFRIIKKADLYYLHPRGKTCIYQASDITIDMYFTGLWHAVYI